METETLPAKAPITADQRRADGYIKHRGVWVKPVRIVAQATGPNRHQRREARKLARQGR